MSTLFENPHQHPLQIPVFQSIENAFSKTVMVCNMTSGGLRVTFLSSVAKFEAG